MIATLATSQNWIFIYLFIYLFAVILNVSFVFQFCSHPLANLARSGYYQNMKGNFLNPKPK
jgi:hypothetical protein